jgi:4-alpha-glucanotransferase
MFWNELYLDLGALAAEAGLPAPKAPPIPDAPLIDYRAQYRWRRAALEPIARRLLERRGDDIDAWAATSGAFDYAAFRALVETHRAGWPAWPDRWRDDPPPIASRDDALAAGIDRARLDTHVVAQWAMEQQLERLARDRPDVHLYLDLPVGVSLDAYEVWRDRSLFLQSLAAGAPPDPLFLGGQNWGLPPLSPIASRRDHYRYVIRCLRHHMRVAGMLRIDHVMGLFRLYVVPEGRPATDGVYLRYHAEDMLAILALESNRHHCALVGEDLGTVPDYVRPAMQRHAMFRIHVGQWFMPTRKGEGTGAAPPESVASLNTHDTATFAGWWNGADIDDARDLDLITAEQAEKDHATRTAQQTAILAMARRPRTDSLTDVERAMVTSTADLAAGAAEVVLISLDDLSLEPVPHNVPGTTHERPNWQRRVPGWATALEPDAPAAAREAVDAVTRARPG